MAPILELTLHTFFAFWKKKSILKVLVCCILCKHQKTDNTGTLEMVQYGAIILEHIIFVLFSCSARWF